MGDSNCDGGLTNGHVLNKKLNTAGWGLFLIWIGIVLLTDAGRSIGFLGVGVITLGVQLARKYFGLKSDGFSVAVGFLFFFGAFWELLDIKLGFLPFICISAGAGFLVSMLVGKPSYSTNVKIHSTWPLER